MALGLCITYGLKNYLEKFDSMSSTLKDFVIEYTKKCDRCHYCVQTDKTGTRPLAYLPIDYNREKYELCPYFPGYTYSWTSIDDELVDRIIEFLSFMDEFISKKL